MTAGARPQDPGVVEWTGGLRPPQVALLAAHDGSTDGVWRPVVVSDAAWLSALGSDGRPSLDIVEELAGRRARGLAAAREEIVAVALPRHPPHTLLYRMQAADGWSRTWVHGSGAWHDLDDPRAWGDDERIVEARRRARSLPWLGGVPAGRHGELVRLVGDRMATLPVRRWGLASAIDRIVRPPAPHDEIAFLALGCEPDASIIPAGLGPELAAVLADIGGRTHGRFGPGTPLDVVICTFEPSDGAKPDGDLIRELVGLSEANERIVAKRLVDLLDRFDAEIAPRLADEEDEDPEDEDEPPSEQDEDDELEWDDGDD